MPLNHNYAGILVFGIAMIVQDVPLIQRILLQRCIHHFATGKMLIVKIQHLKDKDLVQIQVQLKNVILQITSFAMRASHAYRKVTSSNYSDCILGVLYYHF